MSEKHKENLFTALRNASCSRGWLRWTVQLFFGIIIVSSFTLILLMSLKSKNTSDKSQTRCKINNCRVVCFETPYYEKFEKDIIEAAWQTNALCPTIVLTLQKPHFPNSTLPESWLSNIRSNIHELAIIGGNLKHIPHRAFNSQFSSQLDTLILEKVSVASWEPETFMGLTSLKKLYNKDSIFENVARNALQAVDDTLEFIDIQASFEWDPRNITGSADLVALSVVDFSLNPFYSILDEYSFSQLRVCKILYLNSCRISYLGLGTFDALESIEKIHLNDNLLVAVSNGLFQKIIPRNPRIALHDNMWYCNCSFTDIRNLTTHGLIIVEPICRYPENMRGNTFSDFNAFCESTSIPDTDLDVRYTKSTDRHLFQINGMCYNATCKVFRVDSDLDDNGCHFNRFKINEIDRARILHSEYQDNDWLKLKLSVRSNEFSTVELLSKNLTDKGLLWFESSCSEEVYCMNSIPDVLKIFDQRFGSTYTFCPYDLRSSIIKHCVSYNLSGIYMNIPNTQSTFMIIGFTILSLICLICGAICVYALIHRNPNLLKGNKRIVFVKHKEINALILPPQVPYRQSDHIDNENNIFFVTSSLRQRESLTNLDRSDSFNSSSNEVSYISALQPTDEQLAQWRIKQSISQCNSSDYFTNIFDRNSLPYYSMNGKIYDTYVTK